MRFWLLTIVPVLTIFLSSIVNCKEWITIEDPAERWETYCEFMKYDATQCQQAKNCDASYSDDECVTRESAPDAIQSCNSAPADHKFKYIRRTLTRKPCSQLKYKCKCERNWFWGGNDCKCVNPKVPPSFPTSGLIRWEGTVFVDNDDPSGNYERVTGHYNMFGEVQKNENGWYLKKSTNKYYDESRRKTDKVEFEIIIPKEDKGFTKYTGDNTTKNCKKSHVDNEGQLSSIWEYPEEYEIQSEKHIRGNKFLESWKRFDQGEDFDETWIWTVEYDNNNKVAIPIKFYFKLIDGFMSFANTANYAYQYQPVVPDADQFKLEDYCNVV